MMQSTLDILGDAFHRPTDIEHDFQQFYTKFNGQRHVLSTSFSKEDQVLSHLIWSLQLPIDIFTLDTGRLFPETYSVWSRTIERYKMPIKTYFPNTLEVEEMIEASGPNSFYISLEDRKKCCSIRKVHPLQRALHNYDIWITGIRSAHSQHRQHMPIVERDEVHQLYKVHPLLHWTDSDLSAYILEHNIPYNSLHDKGFASIGCAPCTRAISPVEDPRAGRWWWEDKSNKECGLHTSK